jgi:pimeloyl-ACP methyl ester carboxylesterase
MPALHHLVVLAAVAAASLRPAAMAQEPALSLSALDRHGAAVSAAVDGNAIVLRAALDRPAQQPTAVTFERDGAPTPLGRCTIARSASRCDSAPLATLGWSWNADGTPHRLHTLRARTRDRRAGTTLELAPRPVVLVHGLLSSAATWNAYTRSGGLLEHAGLRGHAVGDGQVPGALNTGSLAQPTAATLSLRANAAQLAQYIAGVRAASGAEMVDLVAHSMGGLIARYYIDRLMTGRDVAQLLTLGTPHGGSDCSGLASSLGFLAPAALELRPDYVQRIFNRAITRRHGVPFAMLAGEAITEGFKAPCSGVPSDLVVALDSAAAVPGSVMRLPVLHTDMTASEEVFRRFVLPQLQRTTFPADGDTGLPPESSTPAQFTQVFAGRVEAGQSRELQVQLDEVAIASFALFDPTRSLQLTVRGASGNVIELSPQAHGLIMVDDPEALVHLGYGVAKPRPGPWRITLQAPPHNGADFALSVRVVGGATLQARATPALPTTRQAVTLSATLEMPGKPLSDVVMHAIVHRPDGRSETVPMRVTGAQATGPWRPMVAGVHGIDIVAQARGGGMPLERTRFLAVDVRP